MVDMSDQVDESNGKPAGDFDVVLAGRRVWFKHLGSGQMIMLRRLLNKARVQAEGDPETVAAAGGVMIEHMLNAIDAMFIDVADQEFVETAMVAGKIDLQDLMNVISGGVTPSTPDDVAPTKKPRKATTKKAVKKAVKKTVRPAAKRVQR